MLGARGAPTAAAAAAATTSPSRVVEEEEEEGNSRVPGWWAADPVEEKEEEEDLPPPLAGEKKAEGRTTLVSELPVPAVSGEEVDGWEVGGGAWWGVGWASVCAMGKSPGGRFIGAGGEV